MKVTILLLMLMIFAILVMMSGCEEYVIENTIDTVYIDRPIQAIAASFITKKDTIVIRDTVSTTVVIRDTIVQQVHTTDTVYQVVTKDSVIIKEVQLTEYDTIYITLYDTIINNIHHYDTIRQTVTLYDTVIVYDRTVTYYDTMYMPGYTRPTWDVPLDLMPHLEEFYSEAQARGINPASGMLIIQYTDNLPGEGWASSSFQMNENDQWVIFLDQRLPEKLHRASILRELGRLSLNKKYTTDTAKIMCPLFTPDRVITTNDLNELFN